MSATKQYVMVRLTRSTHAALNRALASMLAGERLRRVKLDRDQTGRVPLDQAVRVLLEMRENHARRRRKALRARGTVRAGASVSATVQVSQVEEPGGSPPDPLTVPLPVPVPED